MGLTVSVFRTSRNGKAVDCTNGGISASHDQLTVVNVSGPVNPRDDAPAVILENGPLGSKRLVPAVEVADLADVPEGQPVYYGIYPRDRVAWTRAPGWAMAGGNYGSTSDSRFSEAVGFYGAVKIHDRYEVQS